MVLAPRAIAALSLTAFCRRPSHQCKGPSCGFTGRQFRRRGPGAGWSRRGRGTPLILLLATQQDFAAGNNNNSYSYSSLSSKGSMSSVSPSPGSSTADGTEAQASTGRSYATSVVSTSTVQHHASDSIPTGLTRSSHRGARKFIRSDAQPAVFRWLEQAIADRLPMAKSFHRFFSSIYKFYKLQARQELKTSDLRPGSSLAVPAVLNNFEFTTTQAYVSFFVIEEFVPLIHEWLLSVDADHRVLFEDLFSSLNAAVELQIGPQSHYSANFRRRVARPSSPLIPTSIIVHDTLSFHKAGMESPYAETRSLTSSLGSRWPTAPRLLSSSSSSGSSSSSSYSIGGHRPYSSWEASPSGSPGVSREGRTSTAHQGLPAAAWPGRPVASADDGPGPTHSHSQKASTALSKLTISNSFASARASTAVQDHGRTLSPESRSPSAEKSSSRPATASVAFSGTALSSPLTTTTTTTSRHQGSLRLIPAAMSSPAKDPSAHRRHSPSKARPPSEEDAEAALHAKTHQSRDFYWKTVAPLTDTEKKLREMQKKETLHRSNPYYKFNRWVGGPPAPASTLHSKDNGVPGLLHLKKRQEDNVAQEEAYMRTYQGYVQRITKGMNTDFRQVGGEGQEQVLHMDRSLYDMAVDMDKVQRDIAASAPTKSHMKTVFINSSTSMSPSGGMSSTTSHRLTRSTPALEQMAATLGVGTFPKISPDQAGRGTSTHHQFPAYSPEMMRAALGKRTGEKVSDESFPSGPFGRFE